jgi:AcrR family transcriptional regulator
MERKTDPRVIRTRHMLRDALIALILEKGYDELTIQDITDRADLRRATFYLHYKDKEELLMAILGETFDSLVCEIDKLNIMMITPDAEYSMHLVILKHAQANANLYLSILSGHGAATITRYVREYLAQNFMKEFSTRNPDLQPTMPIDVLATFAATLKFNLALWWLEQGMPYPAEQMAEMCAKLTLNGMSGALSPKSGQQQKPAAIR